MKVIQKYLLAALTGLAFLAFPSSAIAREREIDPLKYGGVYYVPSETMIDVPAAPEGYKAVHISTYNRHGARYSESESAYRVLKQAFEAGENSMTPYGKEFADAYLEFEKIAHIRVGDLTHLGWDQLKRLGAKMYDSCPDIFSADPEIRAISTYVPRALLSMTAFCNALLEKDNTLDIREEESLMFLDYLNPYSPHCELNLPVDQFIRSKKAWWYGECRDMFNKLVDSDKILSRLFTDLSVLEGIDRFELLTALHVLAVGTQCIDSHVCTYDFMTLFKEKELKAMWEVDNYRFYAIKGPCPKNRGRGYQIMWPMLDKMLADGREALASDRPTVKLHFGHDGCLMGLLTLMDAGEWGRETDDPYEVKDFWRSYEIPMAANACLTIYRKGDSREDALVSFVLNGIPADLPLEKVGGCYYRWDDFCRHYTETVSNARKSLAVTDRDSVDVYKKLD